MDGRAFPQDLDRQNTFAPPISGIPKGHDRDFFARQQKYREITAFSTSFVYFV
jgi:hypothetical protein